MPLLALRQMIQSILGSAREWYFDQDFLTTASHPACAETTYSSLSLYLMVIPYFRWIVGSSPWSNSNQESPRTGSWREIDGTRGNAFFLKFRVHFDEHRLLDQPYLSALFSLKAFLIWLLVF